MTTINNYNTEIHSDLVSDTVVMDITPAQRDGAITAFGFTPDFAAIGKMFRLNRQQLEYLADAYSLRIPDEQYSAKQLEMREMYEAGTSPTAISKVLGCHVTSVTASAGKFMWDRSKQVRAGRGHGSGKANMLRCAAYAKELLEDPNNGVDTKNLAVALAVAKFWYDENLNVNYSSVFPAIKTLEQN